MQKFMSRRKSNRSFQSSTGAGILHLFPVNHAIFALKIVCSITPGPREGTEREIRQEHILVPIIGYATVP